MRTILAGFTAALILAPAVASAQYYEGGGYRRPHDHVEVYRHGDHEDVVVRHHHPRRYEERRFYEEHHHHHHDFDD
ncbi:hypothetical protein [Methylobacterium sp. CM6257]|jgi:hypothetical protein